jgi:hypothetical protein
VLDVLFRNVEFVTRLAKGATCWAIGVGAIWRCYDRLCDLNGMYAMVLCTLFGLTMVGLGVSLINEESDEQQQGEAQ